ncbi:protein kinase [Nocardia sp. CA2R105]|uniref:serine/threonine-protein kinase n=1 Tax=Nocardia coffeae TaxID=2873381 RepID=UPI001CA60D7F|nr:serine/threonine-protein kinase [Nocardia coffeae]MBY8863621.1 protein kinase [Nocardia coffeae]
MASGIVGELLAAGFGEPVEVGRGGSGVVYRCREYALDRHVAVKLLLSEVRGDEREQFACEQRALGRLSVHPHIVQALHVDLTSTGRPYIVMPYFRRGSLDERMRRAGPLRWPEALSIGVKVAGALAAAHAAGMVHRDVKPGNILLTDYGEPQLSDFGIVHVGEITTSSVPLVHGTLSFTAPEVLRGATATGAADIYGLGATMFCLLTGHAPFGRRDGEPLEVQLARIADGELPDLREHGVPGAVCAAVELAMARVPADRPASVVEFGERLRDVQRESGQPVDAMVVPPRGGEDSANEEPCSSMLRSYSVGSVSTPPPPSAATKFRPPTAARTAIDRTRLRKALDASGGRRVILIHGPAGFGKTTLAAQWATTLEAGGVPVAWLTTDHDDDNVVWFLAHLIQAIRRVRPELARELGALLEERSSDATRAVLSALIDEIHDGDRAMVLMVDDWQLVRGENTLAAMNYLLEHGCHHLRIVLVTRGREGLALTKLLVQDELVEIDSAALRFDATEATTFLVGRSGLRLAAEDVAKLRKSTEGWAAGLQLAQLSLAGRDDPVAFIDNLTGRHHVIGEYLAENVLDSLDQPLLEFLMSTSITGTTCADLAATLSGRSDSQELLELVADRNLFLQRMDENDEWFRYHRLFADYLVRKLEHQDPDMAEQLHSRASGWFAEHEMLTEAVDHALIANDPQRAVELVDARALDLIQSFRTSTFLGLMAKLPIPLTESRPRLQLCLVWANLGLERHTQFHAALDRACAAIEANDNGELAGLALRAEAMLLTGLERYDLDRLDGVPQLVTEHIDDLATPMVSVAAADLHAVDALNRFDYPAVERWHRSSLRYGANTGAFVVQHSHCVAGLAALEQFDIFRAEQHFTVIPTVPRGADLGTRISLMSGALLGDLRYHQGRLIEAEQLLRAAATLERQGGMPDFLLAIYGTGARLAAVLGDLAEAERLLNMGVQIAEENSLPRLAARITNERIRADLPVPEDIRIRLTCLPPYQRQDSRVDAVIAELAQDSVIRLLLAERSPVAVGEACDRARTLVHEIDGQIRPKALLQAQLLHACCQWAAGHYQEAKSTAGPAISRCLAQGVPRLVDDAGPGIRDILGALSVG